MSLLPAALNITNTIIRNTVNLLFESLDENVTDLVCLNYVEKSAFYSYYILPNFDKKFLLGTYN